MPIGKYQLIVRQSHSTYSNFILHYSNSIKLTLFQHLINPDSIIGGISSVALSNDDYLPDLVDPDGNENEIR